MARKSCEYILTPSSLSVAFLEVYTKVKIERAVAARLVIVVADVGQADIVGHIKIEHAETYTTTDAETAVKAIETLILTIFTKGTNLSVRVVVLNAAINTHSQISTEEWMD